MWHIRYVNWHIRYVMWHIGNVNWHIGNVKLITFLFTQSLDGSFNNDFSASCSQMARALELSGNRRVPSDRHHDKVKALDRNGLTGVISVPARSGSKGATIKLERLSLEEFVQCFRVSAS